MVDTYKQYISEIHDKFQYWATWLPGMPIRLGDVGLLDGLVFQPRSTLASFGIGGFEIVEDDSNENYEHTSSSGVEMTFKAKGEANAAFSNVGEADAGVSIKFSGENGIVFTLTKCKEHRIKDQEPIIRRMLALHGQHAWPGDYAVVSSVVAAGSGSILISNSRESQIELKATADIGTVVDLGKIEAGLSIAYSKDMHTQIVASSGFTPLFKALRIKTSIWTGNADVRELEHAASQRGEPEVEEVDFQSEVRELELATRT